MDDHTYTKEKQDAMEVIVEGSFSPFQDQLLPESPKRSGRPVQSPVEVWLLLQELSNDQEELSNHKEELSIDQEELSSDLEELSNHQEELSIDLVELSSDLEELSNDQEELSIDLVELSSDREELSSDREELSNDREELAAIMPQTVDEFLEEMERERDDTKDFLKCLKPKFSELRYDEIRRQPFLIGKKSATDRLTTFTPFKMEKSMKYKDLKNKVKYCGYSSLTLVLCDESTEVLYKCSMGLNPPSTHLPAKSSDLHTCSLDLNSPSQNHTATSSDMLHTCSLDLNSPSRNHTATSSDVLYRWAMRYHQPTEPQNQ